MEKAVSQCAHYKRSLVHLWRIVQTSFSKESYEAKKKREARKEDLFRGTQMVTMMVSWGSRGWVTGEKRGLYLSTISSTKKNSKAKKRRQEKGKGNGFTRKLGKRTIDA